MSLSSNILPDATVTPRAYVLGDRRDPQAALVVATQGSTAAEVAAYRKGHADGQRAGRSAGLEAGHTQGLAAGRAEGLQAGQQQAQAEARRAAAAQIQAARDTLGRALEALAAQRARLLADARADVLRLAMAVARKVVHAEIDASRHIAERVVAAAIEQVQDNTVLRVRLSPRDHEHLELGHGAFDGIVLAADPDISPGGCVVETDCGAIDATVESQWDAVAAALLGALASEEAAEGIADCRLPIADCGAPGAERPGERPAGPQPEPAGPEAQTPEPGSQTKA